MSQTTTDSQKFWRDLFLWLAAGGSGLFLCGLIVIFLFWTSGNLQTIVEPTVEPLIFPSRTPESGLPINETSLPSAATAVNQPNLNPFGQIVYVCQVFKLSARDQICIMNGDGSNQRRLTTTDSAKHYYPSLAPDGLSVIYAANLAGAGQYDIYEQKIDSTEAVRLTNNLGILNGPEISPDGQWIAFMRGDGVSSNEIWVMNRDGSSPHKVYAPGWDPTWSPDGSKILFASLVSNSIQLMVVNADGSNPQIITKMPNLRGRSDWSNDGLYLVTYSGTPWNRELFIMNADGSDPKQITPVGGNSQGPSFSPDGEWVVFTAYFDLYGDDHGCEIYIMKIDGSSLTRLTNNEYCDWQPRWGP